MHRPSYALIAALLAISCTGSQPVEWGEIVYQDTPPEPLDVRLPSATSLEEGGCPGSLRIAQAGRFLYAAWWQARPDSSVMLMAARSGSGGPWSKPVIADSTDHGSHGCGRPAPSIAADSTTGYVHLAYFVEPPNGGGVFFAHSMDSAVTVHAPVAIVYGNSLSRASVAASGDRVVVAYEDPNAGEPLIGLALSRTTGHIFEQRMQATSSNGRAREPVVRLQGDSIRLWWSEYSPDPALSATRPMYRAGKWK
jgi:hypothetical protein